MRDLCAATDYPKFDIDMTVDEFKEWEHDKEHSIVGYRNKAFKSPCTGTMAPVHHTPWLEAMDELDEDVSRGQGEGCRGIGSPLRLRRAPASSPDRSAGSARCAPAAASAGRRACRSRPACRAPLVTSTRASAIVFFKIGERVALVIDADLRAADMHAIAVADRLIALHLEADQAFAADALCAGSAPRGR